MIYLISFIFLYILFSYCFSKIFDNKNEKILISLRENLDENEEIIQYSFFHCALPSASFFPAIFLAINFRVFFKALEDIITFIVVLLIAYFPAHFFIKYGFSEILIVTNKAVIHHRNCIKAKMYFNEINKVTFINYLVGKVILFRLQNNKTIYIWNFPKSKELYKKINEMIDNTT